jgi:hypothetical protein
MRNAIIVRRRTPRRRELRAMLEEAHASAVRVVAEAGCERGGRAGAM